MRLNNEGLKDRRAWEAAGIRLPQFDREAVLASPETAWVHFGPGNLFRAFPALVQQSLLEQGLVSSGIYAAALSNETAPDQIYAPHDCLSLLVTLLPDGTMEKTVVGSVAGFLRANDAYPHEYQRLRELFRAPSLQMASFTITEKGYALADLHGRPTAQAEADFSAGPGKSGSAMGKAAGLLLERFQAGGAPIAMVSMDNCSHNGERLRRGVLTMAQQWLDRGLVKRGFVDWLEDEQCVSFPWTMIDKITPGPAPRVAEALAAARIEGMEIQSNGKAAPFVNAEKPQYLVIEDRFPNGRPPLEKAGVLMTGRDTVNKAERMKVMTCLNPLHTALAVYGCLLGYDSIAAEMRDPELKALVEKIGYAEGMPVVTDPGVIRPMDFIREVIGQRFPNPFLPDTPQRIAADTSQKLSVRFGETIKAYAERPDLDPKDLTFIPLVIAGWLRYLLGVDDEGKPFPCSGDPMLAELQGRLSGVILGQPSSVDGKLTDILRNSVIFGSDLTALGLGEKIEGMVRELLAGPGAVRAVLKAYLGN